MSDDQSKSSKKKEKREKSPEQKSTEQKSTEQKSTEQKASKTDQKATKPSRDAEKPSSSTRTKSKERDTEQLGKSTTEPKKEIKTKDINKDYQSKSALEDPNKAVRRKRSGKLRRFLSLIPSEDSLSFHSIVSSSYYSPSEASLYRSAASVDIPTTLKSQQSAHSIKKEQSAHSVKKEQSEQPLNLAQRLTRRISSLLPTVRPGTDVQQTAASQPHSIAKPSQDVGVQTSKTLTQLQPEVGQPAIEQHPASKHLTVHLPSIQEVTPPLSDQAPTAAPTTPETETAQKTQQKRFFEDSLPSLDTISEVKKEDDKVKTPKEQPSVASVDHSETISDAFKRHDSNYDHDKGGYTSEVDDVVDDSLKQRVKQRRETREKEREKGAQETTETTKDLEKQKSFRKMHSMSSRLETNLKIGTAFVYMIIPPDGGFAWIIMIMSFFSQVIVDGIVFSVGILLPYMAKDLNASTSTIALVASIQVGCYFFSGPITSAFINKFGFRMVALMGVTVAICTLSIATLSTNLTMLIIFYSIIGGPSLSMIWVSSQLIIGYYFEKYRPIASGISCAGAGAGLIVFSYLNAHIVQTIGWRNTSRVNIGILFLVILIALTFLEVKPTKIAEMPEETETDSDEVEHFYNSSRYTKPDIAARSIFNLKKGLGDNLVEMPSQEETQKGKMERCLVACCPAFGRYTKKGGKTSAMDADKKRFVIRADPIERQDIYYTGPAEYEERDNASNIDLGGGDIKMLKQNPEKIRTINYTLSMMQLSKAAKEKQKKKKQRASVLVEFLYFISPSNWLPVKVKRAFHILFDFHLLKIMEFKVLCLSAVCFSSGFNIPFVYSKERAVIDDFYEFLISPSIGLSNLIFRIACGFIAFKYKQFTTYMCGGGLFFGGLVTFISAFYGHDTVWFQFVYAGCYGVAPAFYSTLRSIIYVRYLGLENLTTAFGLTAMGMGIGVFIGTSMGGLLYEVTGGLSVSFMFSGSSLMISGGLKLLLPTLTEWKKKRRAIADTKA